MKFKLLPAGREAPTRKPRKTYQRSQPGISHCSTALASLSDFLFYVIWGKSFPPKPPPWVQTTYWPFGMNGLNKRSANFITFHSLLILDPISKGGAEVRGLGCWHQPHMPPAGSPLTATRVYVLLELTRCCCQTACSALLLGPCGVAGAAPGTRRHQQTPPAQAEPGSGQAQLRPVPGKTRTSHSEAADHHPPREAVCF